jgi:hypothetical protein
MSITDYRNAKEDEKEIEVNGILYDIVAVRFDGDKVCLKAIKDEGETNCLEKFDSFASLMKKNGSPQTADENIFSRKQNYGSIVSTCGKENEPFFE